jgi:hypothetical protein
MLRCLKLQSQCHLDYPRPARVTVVEGGRAAQRAECAVVLRPIASKYGEIGVIESVEEVGPIFEFQALVNLKRLRRGCVKAD